MTTRLPAVLAIRPGVVHVWRISADEVNVARARERLSPEEISRASQFRSVGARNEFVVGRGALRTLLGFYLNTPPHAIRLSQGIHGKPELAPEHASSGLQFNVSHSNGLILEAVSLSPVGIDVELIRPDVTLDELAPSVFTSRETTLVLAQPHGRQSRSLFRCWTRKEAVAKALGYGLSDESRHFEILPELSCSNSLRIHGHFNTCDWTVLDLEEMDGYSAALAVADRNCDLQRFTLSL